MSKESPLLEFVESTIPVPEQVLLPDEEPLSPTVETSSPLGPNDLLPPARKTFANSLILDELPHAPQRPTLPW